MIRKLKISSILLLAFVLIQSKEAAGQNVYFTGLGRALFSIDKLMDDKQPDVWQRASSGYTLFDLGVNVENDGLFRAGAIVRLRNEFGGFFGDGTSLDIRQVQAEGVIGNKVKFEMGDIYLSQTPYTLWNFDESYHKYESDLFAMRRSVVYYENFFINNNWRVQGVNTKARLKFSNIIRHIDLNAYGARIISSDLISVPDRFLYGGRIEVDQSSFFKIGGNITGISDIAGTVEDTEVKYNNLVAATDFIVTYDKGEKFKYELKGETGVSSFSLDQVSSQTSNSFNDYFFDIGVVTTYKPLNIEVGAKYRDVGPAFNSPGAQTRKIHDINTIQLNTFPTYNDEATSRPIALYDRISQEEGLYANSLSTVLLPYLPQYNNIEPYGLATPNRRGISLSAAYKHPEEIVLLTAGSDILSEIFPEGDSVSQNLRSFLGFRGGFAVKIDKIIGFDKDLMIHAGGRYEDTYREGSNPVDFQSFLLDAGLDVEVITKLHLLGGLKLLKANGNEFVSVRNAFNEITAFNNWIIDLDEKMYAAGIRYDFTSTVFFSTQFLISDYNDHIDTTNNFRLKQWFFLFNYRF